MEPTHIIDESAPPHICRRIVVWRRLEKGDDRTPGTELAPESDFLEAKILDIGIASQMLTDIERLWKVREQVLAPTQAWKTKYEPAGVLFTLGASVLMGIWLDYLLPSLFAPAASLIVLAVFVGFYTRIQRNRAQRDAKKRWNDAPEKEAFDTMEMALRQYWKRFSKTLQEANDFRTEVRTGTSANDISLASLNANQMGDPENWRPSAIDNEIRYGSFVQEGAYITRTAEIEDEDTTPSTVETDATR